MMIQSLTSAAKIGILGGSFDPIHFGHLAIAEAAREHYSLDAVLFIPAGEPPHKTDLNANAEERYLMTLLATNDHPQFFVSRCEIDRPGRSYTVDTLRDLQQLYPQAKLYLLMGFDSAIEFADWRDSAIIKQLATVAAVTRPGFTHEELSGVEKSGVQLLHTLGLRISSSELRMRIEAGKSLRFLLPLSVVNFITREGLYSNSKK